MLYIAEGKVLRRLSDKPGDHSCVYVLSLPSRCRRYKYQTGRELEKAREQDKTAEELSDKDFDHFSSLLRGLTNRYAFLVFRRRRRCLPPFLHGGRIYTRTCGMEWNGLEPQ